MIDMCSHASVSDIRVHRIGEIDYGRPARQRENLALRREDVNLVGEKVDFHVFEELGRVTGRTLQFEQ